MARVLQFLHAIMQIQFEMEISGVRLNVFFRLINMVFQDLLETARINCYHVNGAITMFDMLLFSLSKIDQIVKLNDQIRRMQTLKRYFSA